jgi:hypothetical protein
LLLLVAVVVEVVEILREQGKLAELVALYQVFLVTKVRAVTGEQEILGLLALQLQVQTELVMALAEAEAEQEEKMFHLYLIHLALLVETAHKAMF